MSIEDAQCAHQFIKYEGLYTESWWLINLWLINLQCEKSMMEVMNDLLVC